MASSSVSAGIAGAGLGLRPEHFQDFIRSPQPVDWIEILTDNYLVPGGKPLYFLEKIRSDYPVTMHGVAMNLGSVDPLDLDYLKRVRGLADRIDAHYVSDHLCWTGFAGQRLYDLLPMPFTEESVEHMVQRIQLAQEILGRPLVVENLSSYLANPSGMREWEFISEIVTRSGCLLLLDVNNIYVSSRNHGFNPIDYLEGISRCPVALCHMAGHTDYGDHCIDTHDREICDDVWRLYRKTLQMLGVAVPTLVERDDDIPEIGVLLRELDRIREYQQQLTEPHSGVPYL